MRNLAALLADYTAALNCYDLETVENMFSESAVYVSPGLNGEIKGRAAIRAAFRRYFAEHPDQVNVDEEARALDAHTLQARWRLESSKSKRSGNQIINFNAEGRIQRIEVRDD